MCLFVMFLTNSCRKENEFNVTSYPVTDILTTTAACKGIVILYNEPKLKARGFCWSTHELPTIFDDKTTGGKGEGKGDYTCVITGLTPNTKYYIRAYATNRKETVYGPQYEFKTFEGTFTDIDGNVYPYVTIGTQIWMGANLKVSHFRNGEAIPNVEIDSVWKNLTSGASCKYEKYPEMGLRYGKLYNWYAVHDNRSIAPEGWHIPSDAEWNTLVDYIGADSIAGGKMKSNAYFYWTINVGATNESNFSALLAGRRDNFGEYSLEGGCAYFWSSTFYNGNMAYYRRLQIMDTDVKNDIIEKKYGCSVRCVKD